MQWSVLDWPGHPPDFSPTEVHFTRKLKAEKAMNQVKSADSCSAGLAENQQTSADVSGSYISDSRLLQRIYCM